MAESTHHKLWRKCKDQASALKIDLKGFDAGYGPAIDEVEEVYEKYLDKRSEMVIAKKEPTEIDAESAKYVDKLKKGEQKVRGLITAYLKKVEELQKQHNTYHAGMVLRQMQSHLGYARAHLDGIVHVLEKRGG
jgi:hypothetical protein